MGPHTPQSVGARLRSWLAAPEPPTALLTGNNRVTLATLHALRELPQRLALVGYDDFETADLLDPALTVVHQDAIAMGAVAAQRLFARMLGDESPPSTTLMPTRLIVRASSHPPRRRR